MKTIRHRDAVQKRWFLLLFAALFVYTVKSIFVGADIDEAYGVTVGYRLVQGDRLMWDMWEPHQTSAIFTAACIRVIFLFTGGSLRYLTVFLRVLFFLIQTGIACYVYVCLKRCLPGVTRDERLLFAMIYYITTPKCIYVPEYSNLHMWFSTLLALFLMQYYCQASLGRGKRRYLFLAGAALACDVLSYPSMVLFYPVCAAVILVQTRKLLQRKGIADVLYFTAPCVLGAAAFTGYIFSYMDLRDVQTVLPCILQDGSHQVETTGKLLVWGKGAAELLLITVGCGAAALMPVCLLRSRRRRQGQSEGDFGTAMLFWWFLWQTVYQAVYWMYTEYNSGYPQVAYVMVPVIGMLLVRKRAATVRTGMYLAGMGLLNFVGLNLFSNWGPTSLTVYLVLGLLGGLLCWRAYFLEKCPAHALRLIRTICVVFILSEVFGRCFLVIGGDTDSNRIYQVRGFNRDGVRGGILASYMNAYRYNNNYELFPEIVPAGSNVLYLGPSQFYYMMGDCRIAAPSTISTPEYDDHLQMYYELHPERFPDVVVVESLYGDVSYFGEDNYIYTWLEEEFAPYEMEDYPYVRVYRRVGDE